MAENAVTPRVPPHNLNAEKSVLGAMMLDSFALSIAVEKLQAADFYYPVNAEIFKTMCSLMISNTPVDYITLSDSLERRGLLESSGGYEYIAELANYVPSASNVEHYINIIRDHSTLRRLIKGAASIVDQCYENGAESEEAVRFAEKVIFDISQSDKRSDFVTARQAVNEAYATMEDRYENGEPLSGISTGFTELDYKLKGMQKAQLIVIGGRSSMGKSAFAMNIMQFAAIYRQKTCAVFSLEMPYEMIAQRMLSSGSHVALENIHTGILQDDDWPRLAKTRNELGECRMFIDDTPGITTMEILSKCRRLKMEYGLDLVMVDYLQLVNPGPNSKRESRTLDVSEMTRAFKLMARELEVPIILLSQLSRAVDGRADHKPVLSDLRESGSIEQDADVVLFIYRGSYYGDYSNGNDAEIIVAKNRNGPVGSVRAAWNDQTASYENIDPNRH